MSYARVYEPTAEDVAALVRVIRRLVAVLREIEQAPDIDTAHRLARAETTKMQGVKP